MSDKPLPVILNDIKSKAWNESIAPRTVAVRDYFKAEQWTLGVGAWLKSVESALIDKLMFGCKTRDEDQFVRGQIAMLREICDLPAKIDSLENQKKSKSVPTGTAGY